MKHNILFIDDDESLRAIYTKLLRQDGFEVHPVSTGEEAVALIKQKIKKFSVAIVDFHIPGGMNGAETIAAIKELDEQTLFCGLSGDETDMPFSQSLGAGAVVFIQKGTSSEKVVHQIKALVTQYENQFGVITKVEQNVEGYEAAIKRIGLVGQSAKLAEVAQLVTKFAPYSTNILIRGENGTGKEQTARAFHERTANGIRTSQRSC